LADCFGQGFAFEGEDALLKLLGCIARQDFAGPLQDDRSVIVLVVDPVYGAARYLHTEFDRGFMDTESIHSFAAKRRNERGVDIHHASIKVGWNSEVLKVAAHDDQLRSRFANGIKNALRVEQWIGEIASPDDSCRDASLGCEVKAASIFAGTDHESEVNRQRSRSLLIDQVAQRGPATGNQNCDRKIAHEVLIALVEP